MQIIKHDKDYSHIHPIFNEFEKLYTALSNNDEEISQGKLFTPKPVFESALYPFESIFNEYGNCEIFLSYVDKNYSKLPKAKYDKKNIMVAFSGGKDSTAVALYYKEKGYNVYLYHVHGLNKFYPYEYQSCEAIAKYLDMPLIVENVSLCGTSLYPDHPLKNIIIANMALQYGIEHNIGTHIAVGDYYTAFLDDVCFETSGDDCIEMWEEYIPIIQQYIPQAEVEIPLENVADTFERLEHDKDLLALTQSCVMTYRFKEYHSKRVQSKYNVKLLPNRCGTCWKCALEYIYYTDRGILDYDAKYYSYCLDVLGKTYQKETGVKHTIEEVWNNYFFYDREQSKYFTDK